MRPLRIAWAFFVYCFLDCRTRSEDSADRIGRKSGTECAAEGIRRGGYAERKKVSTVVTESCPGRQNLERGLFEAPFEFCLPVPERISVNLPSLLSLGTSSLHEGSPACPILLHGGLMDNWWVYIVEKKTGLYVGITTDLENRMRQHGQPAPLHYEGPVSKTDALKRERTLKGWSRKKKLELIAKTPSQQK
jgi:predicted GIY-YIG superfamily endonuclease